MHKVARAIRNAPVQGRSRHTEVASDLSGWLTRGYQVLGVADLALGVLRPAAAKVLAGGAALGDGVCEPQRLVAF